MIKAALQPFVKVYNLVQRQFAYSTQVDHQGKYLPYNHPYDNSIAYDYFPSHLSKLIDESPTATACISTYADFLTGEGFNNADLEKLIINPQGLTFFQFHEGICRSVARYYGAAVLVKYNAMGDPIAWYNLPFENCRLGKPDDKGIISKIHYNPYFGTSLYKPKDTEIYDAYNPGSAVIQAQKDGFLGQILWFSLNASPYYPIPDIFSAKDSMEIEHRSAEYAKNNLKGGFLQPTIFRLIGDPNQPAYPDHINEEYRTITKGEAFSKMMSDEFQGSERTGNVIVFWGSSREEWPEPIAFPTNNNADLFKTQDDQAIKKITIATKVPGILANISEGVSLGGDGNTIRAAVKLMQQRVTRPQRLLTGLYTNILSKLQTPYTDPVYIIAYDPFPELQNVDPSVWQELTTEERRKWIQDNTEIELVTEKIIPQTVPSARYESVYYNTYPEKARNNVKRAIEWQEKTGNKCGGKAGLMFAQKILDGTPLSSKEIKRLSNFLSKNTIHKDKPYGKSCESVNYDAWGGSDMLVWANEKVKEIYG